MRAKIFCGVSGAGKTTLIKEAYPGANVVSADYYFIGADGEYKFDPSKLGEAHGECLRAFVAHMTTSRSRWLPDIVVDNTNTTVAEIAPYAALALAYGFELEIVTVLCDPAIAHARNKHGVPLHSVQAMHERLAQREMPPWWPHRIINI